MRSPTKQGASDRPTTGRQGEPPVAVNCGEAEPEGVVSSTVDALADILQWERASERAIRLAKAAATTDRDGPTN